MGSAYQKTAKDLAFDRERAKLQRQIRDLKEDLSRARSQIKAGAAVIESQEKIIKLKKEENRTLKEMVGLSEEGLQMVLSDAKRNAETAERIKALLGPIDDMLGTY